MGRNVHGASRLKPIPQRSNDTARPHNQIAIVHSFTRPTRQSFKRKKLRLTHVHYSNLGTASFISQWSLSSDRSRSVIALLRQICMQDSDLPERTGRYRLPLHTPVIYVHVSLIVSRLELHKTYNVLVHVYARVPVAGKENSTNEIRLLKLWPGIQNKFLCIGGPGRVIGCRRI